MKTILVATLLFLSGSMAPVMAGEHGLTGAQLTEWLQTYEEAWESLDANKAAAIFTENATYQVDPYSDPHLGREGISEYWSEVTADQKDVEFTSEVLSVTGNTGIAHWHAEFTAASTGAKIILDGIFVLEFSADGLCSSLKEWWAIKI